MSDISCAPLLLTSTGTKRRRQDTLIALLALAAVYVYLLMGPVYKRTILFILAFPLAILANILRIASIILVANYRGEETAMG